MTTATLSDRIRAATSPEAWEQNRIASGDSAESWAALAPKRERIMAAVAKILPYADANPRARTMSDIRATARVTTTAEERDLVDLRMQVFEGGR